MSSIAVKFSCRWYIRLAALALIAAAATGASAHGAQGLGEFIQHLRLMQPRANQALNDPTMAGQVITQLDSDEGTFAHFTTLPGLSRADLLDAYGLLDQMLGDIYQTYHRKHDDCLTSLGNGSNCDYDRLEQLELRALYPLSWLRFHGSILFTNPAARRRILKEAIAGFTQSTLIIVAPELIRENLLGRAYCERDLGQFDRSQYAKAIADFKAVMKAGAGTAQYRAAQQGLATTYAAMGQVGKAAALTAHLSQTTPSSQEGAAEMFRLQQLFKAEASATDPAMRADYHRQAVALIRGFYGTRKWPEMLGAVARYAPDPEAEFGASQDPFEQYLLAEVLLSTHHPLPAAKHYLAAARSGQYPQGYKYAIDIYYSQGRLDLIDAPLQEIERQRHGSMAEWAAYMRFKIAHTRWERGGGTDRGLEQEWIARARDYIDRYPHGRYAFEPRFRLAALAQSAGKFADAAAMYDQVKGDPFYDFAATYKAAECRYLLLAANAGQTAGKSKAMPASTRNALTTAAIAGFRSTVSGAPAVERHWPAQRQFIHAARGRATYLLVTMLEALPHQNNAEIVELLDGFETAYPRMSANFDDVMRWRLAALDSLGRYAQASGEIAKLMAPTRIPPPSNDFLKTVGLDLWKQRKTKQARGDNAGALADAKLTAQVYVYFENQVQAGHMNAKSLTGTLSILGQAYVAMNDSARAKSIFEQVVKAAPSSPDANAGLARLAQANKNYRDASDLWTRVEADAAESDDLWYEARYNLAVIYAVDGKRQAACAKLAQTRSEHPSLGGREMKTRWDSLQRKLCLRDGAAP